jgi:uncharacterized protein YqgC (DUF456 family)
MILSPDEEPHMPPISTEVLYVVSAVMIVVGLVGTLLPAIPGMPLVFAGMLLAAWVGDFQHISGFTVALLAVLTLVSMVVDFIASMLGAKVAGASRWAFIGAGIGALVGLVFGILGLVVGPFVGAVVGEAIATNHVRRAMTAGIGATIGLLFGAVAKIALAFTMLGIFLLALVIG